MTAQERHHNIFLVHRFVQQARRLFQAREYDDALRILTQAYSIDPFAPSALSLEGEIKRKKAGSGRPAVPDRHAKTSSEISAETASSIASHIDKAYQFQRNREFVKALDEIASARVLDPLSEFLHQIEKDMYAEYKKQYQGGHGHGGVVAQAPGTRTGRAQHPPDPGVLPTQTQQETLHASIRAEARQEAIGASRGNGHDGHLPTSEDEHYEQARKSLSQHAYEEALSEIALGLLLNENSKKLRRLEAEIWSAQEDSSRRAPDKRGKAHKLALRSHLTSAEEYLKVRKFDQALDELVKAYMIDPLNAEANRLEQRIRQKQMRQSS
jgi:tetratricopeptide (TPR) repeat protein